MSPLPENTGLYNTAPSGREVMLELAARRYEKGEVPLVGADVVAIIASMKQGVAPRSLRAMGVEPEVLKAAAEAELKAAA